MSGIGKLGGTAFSDAVPARQAAADRGFLSSMKTAGQAPRFNRAAARHGVQHFGLGPFFMNHFAVIMDDVLQKPGQADWAICSHSVTDSTASQEKSRVFQAQDCLYTQTSKSPDGQIGTRVVGAVTAHRHVAQELPATLDDLARPETKIVPMTLTKTGYFTDLDSRRFDLNHPDIQHDLANPTAPKTFFGLVTEGLRRRRDAGLSGFTVLSLDNVVKNGDLARHAVLSFAQARDPQLAAWIDSNVTFPNTMVDRISPRVDADDARQLNAGTGLADAMPQMSEDYIEFVVENRFAAGHPDWSGHVMMTDDITPHEQLKQRNLNAAHVWVALLGTLSGRERVDEVANHAGFRQVMDDFMRQDVLPSLQVPQGRDPDHYRATVLRRFSNPNIRDTICRLSPKTAAKLQNYFKKTITDCLADGRDSSRLALLLAGYVACLNGKQGFAEGEKCLLTDDDYAKAALPGAAPLSMPLFKDWGLAQNAAFAAHFTAFRDSIARDGIDAVVSRLAAGKLPDQGSPRLP